MSTNNYWDILNGVKTSVDNILAGLSPPPSPVPVTSIRHAIEVTDGEIAPLIVIAPGSDYEKIEKLVMPTTIWYDYVVYVALITKGNRILASDLQNYLLLRQGLRDGLFVAKLATVPLVFQTLWKPIPTGANNSIAMLQNTNYRGTGWELTFRTAEQRKG